MPRVHHVKKARKPISRNGKVIVKVGEPYYWWKFRRGGKIVSTKRPRPSQLTQSDKISRARAAAETLEDIEVDDASTLDDLRAEVEAVGDEIEEIATEYRDSREAMPESLQDSDVGQLCEENADSLESWAEEVRNCLDNVDEEEGDWREDARDAISEAASGCPL